MHYPTSIFQTGLMWLLHGATSPKGLFTDPCLLYYYGPIGNSLGLIVATWFGALRRRTNCGAVVWTKIAGGHIVDGLECMVYNLWDRVYGIWYIVWAAADFLASTVT